MNIDIIIVLSILFMTALLLIIDKLRIDIVAVLCMLVLAWTGILSPSEVLSGFSSNAVITMIAVMILGRGVSRTGLMAGFSQLTMKFTGSSRPRIITVMSVASGIMSGFVQNIGAAALFLPSIMNISRSRKIPASELIMPVGFAIILGGSITMIGSGPLMLVNDFLIGASLSPYKLFAVTPVGLVLLFSYLLFFIVLGKYVLPRYKAKEDPGGLQKRLIEEWGLSLNIRYFMISEMSPLIDKSLEDTGIWDEYNLNIIAVNSETSVEFAPWRKTRFEPGQIVAILGKEQNADKFAATHGLVPVARPKKLNLLDDTSGAGFAEVVVPPRSVIAGQSIKNFGLRRNYGVEPVLLYHRGEKITGDFSDVEITPGDIFIVHGLWEKIADMKKGHDFVIITPIETEEKDASRAWIAFLCFVFSAGLAVAGFSIPVSFMSGGIAMVLTGVLPVDEAYNAIDWKVVFFMAGLIPLGIAMQKTGTAIFLAENIISRIHGNHIFIILLAISGITVLFSLFMSNVGAAVILFPMVISMANTLGVDPRPLALLVAVSTSNSFILPTHQVNALYKTPGGYRNMDYVKSGGGLTMLYLAVVVTIIYFFYL